MIIYLISIILGIMAGLIIRKTCSDELFKRKDYFTNFFIFGLIFSIGFYIYGFRIESLSGLFISSLFLVLCLEKNKKFK
jgi:Ca2+/Na+ antiporter